MGLSGAMFTAMSGLQASQVGIEVAGNNIANVNTTGYKYSRAAYETAFLQTMGVGSAPGDVSGGTNPNQIGQGVSVAAAQRLDTQGSIANTGVLTDLAVEGDGLFIVEGAEGSRYYSRNGQFRRNPVDQLVSANGLLLQGYGVDQNFEVVTGELGPITIPFGLSRAAVATSEATLEGNLDASGVPATTGSVLASQAMTDAGGAAASDATLMTDVMSGTTSLFAEGDVLTLNAEKGGRALPEAPFTVGAGSTLGDLSAFLTDALSLNTDAAIGLPASVAIVDGQLVVTGNAGDDNDLTISPSGFSSTNADSPLPFVFEKAAADGASIYTNFQVYDSRGSALTVGVTATLESRDDTGSVWRFFAESVDDTDLNKMLETGNLYFDTNGQFLNFTGSDLAINRAATGATDPLGISLNFATLTSLDTRASSLVMAEQDGFPSGTLSSFSIADDGTIIGTFNNGLSETVGRLALATFANPSGLIAEADSLFTAGPNSGPALIGVPGTLGAGRIKAGALEMSNVDLSREFINLISASTAFSAASRVISTSDQLMQQLLSITR